MKGVVPCIMAGILGIYGLIVSVIIAGTSKLFFYDLNFQLMQNKDTLHTKDTLT